MKKKDFLAELEKEAGRQAKLQQRQILPAELKAISSFVAEKMWQVLLILSFILALAATATRMTMMRGFIYV